MNTTDGGTDLMSAALLRWFQDLSDRGIFTTDVELNVRSWNRWMELQMGLSAEEVIGRPLTAVVPSLAMRGLDQYYRDALAGEVRVLSERFHKFLIPISRSNALRGPAEMAQSARIAPLTAGDTVLGTITVIDDVTERVVTERELRTQIAVSEHARTIAEDASRLKDDFLATLSHEIRTPLNAVLGWARILRTQPEITSRAQAHALEVIERNAGSQLRLVEDLLDMARVVSGKLRLDVRVMPLAEAARAAVDVVQPAADARNIRLDVRIDDVLVHGDADRLQQVVWNLLSNAVKFTPPGGHIQLTIARTDEEVELSVRDTGQGISRDFLPFVFDRFRQADASAGRRHGGLGLGLALVRQIVELHGGSVSVDSEGVNRGTTFTVRLRAVAPDRVAEAGDDAALPMVTLRGVSVLVVEDHDDGREMMATALEAWGAQVLAVASTVAALDAIGSRRFMPDVLVSDVGLPGSDGYELIRRLRAAAPPVRDIPAIAVTAYVDDDDRRRTLEAGYQMHVPKPFDPRVLAASVAQLAPPEP